jgi:hypothetical protein
MGLARKTNGPLAKDGPFMGRFKELERNIALVKRVVPTAPIRYAIQ